MKKYNVTPLPSCFTSRMKTALMNSRDIGTLEHLLEVANKEGWDFYVNRLGPKGHSIMIKWAARNLYLDVKSVCRYLDQEVLDAEDVSLYTDPEVEAHILNGLPISKVFSVRVVNALKILDILTAEQLLNWVKDNGWMSLLKLHNFSRHSFKEVLKWAKENNYIDGPTYYSCTGTHTVKFKQPILLQKVQTEKVDKWPIENTTVLSTREVSSQRSYKMQLGDIIEFPSFKKMNVIEQTRFGKGIRILVSCKRNGKSTYQDISEFRIQPGEVPTCKLMEKLYNKETSIKRLKFLAKRKIYVEGIHLREVKTFEDGKISGTITIKRPYIVEIK